MKTQEFEAIQATVLKTALRMGQEELFAMVNNPDYSMLSNTDITSIAFDKVKKQLNPILLKLYGFKL